MDALAGKQNDSMHPVDDAWKQAIHAGKDHDPASELLLRDRRKETGQTVVPLLQKALKGLIAFVGVQVVL